MVDRQWPAPDCQQLEERIYGPELADGEYDLLQSQIYIYAPGIIKLTEAPMLSPVQLDAYQERLFSLVAGLDEFLMLIDLSKVVSRPKARERARLKELFVAISPKMRMCAVYTEKNFILNIAAKFILGGLGLRSLTVNKHREEALQELGYEP